MEHVRTQMPYAIVVGIITVLFGFLPVGLGMPIWIVLPAAMIIIVLVTYFFGKPVEEKA